jgi:hypothetical protein
VARRLEAGTPRPWTAGGKGVRLPPRPRRGPDGRSLRLGGPGRWPGTVRGALFAVGTARGERHTERSRRPGTKASLPPAAAPAPFGSRLRVPVATAAVPDREVRARVPGTAGSDREPAPAAGWAAARAPDPEPAPARVRRVRAAASASEVPGRAACRPGTSFLTAVASQLQRSYSAAYPSARRVPGSTEDTHADGDSPGRAARRAGPRPVPDRQPIQSADTSLRSPPHSVWNHPSRSVRR